MIYFHCSAVFVKSSIKLKRILQLRKQSWWCPLGLAAISYQVRYYGKETRSTDPGRRLSRGRAELGRKQPKCGPGETVQLEKRCGSGRCFLRLLVYLCGIYVTGNFQDNHWKVGSYYYISYLNFIKYKIDKQYILNLKNTLDWVKHTLYEVKNS